MPNLFDDAEATIASIERWTERRRQVQFTADSVTPDQAVNIRRLARFFPFASPGVLRGLGQAGLGPDDSATQFAITQEMLRNYSTTGDWAGQLGKQQRETKHPTTTDPDAPNKQFNAQEFMHRGGKNSMLHAQNLLRQAETMGVFNPTTQVLVEPDFGEDGEPSAAYNIFTELQDVIYNLSGNPVPYYSRDGVLRGYTPMSGTTGDLPLDAATGQTILPEDRPDPTITGAYRNPSGIGGSIGRVEDYGAGAANKASSQIISQIFADNEAAAAARTIEAGQIKAASFIPGAGTKLPMPATTPALRAGFMALDAPIQEATGQVRNIYGAMHGEDVDWMESQSDLGVVIPRMLRGQPVDMGEGLFMDPESEVARERRRREAERGQIGGHNLSIGRILANGVGFEPDSQAFMIVSGLVDGAAQVADPAAWGLGIGAKASQTRKFFAIADDMEDAGMFARGLRKIYDGPTFHAWANKNTDLINKFAEIDDPYTIGKMTNFKLGPEMEGTLSRIRKPEDIRRYLDSSIERGQISTRTQLEGTRIQQRKQSWTEMHQKLNPSYTPRTVRMFQMMPGQTIDLESPRQVAEQLRRVMMNAHANDADIGAVYNMVARSKNKNDLRAAVMESQSRVGGILDQYGIKNPEMRSILTRTNTETYAMDLRGWIDEVGADVPIWDVMGVDGIPTQIPGPHLPLEHIGRYMHLPDQRAVRRLTTKYNFLTASQTDIPVLSRFTPNKVPNPQKIGAPRLPIAAVDFIMSEVLKPMWLARLAWPVRVVGEEQLRMAAAGLDSMTKHPISYLSTVLGTPETRLARFMDKVTPGLKGKMETSPSGELFSMTEELSQVTYRAHGGWLSQPGVIRSRQPTVFNKNNIDELSDWRSSWAHELALLHNDPVSNFVANHNFDEAVEWLTAGPGLKFRRELMSAHPGNLETPEQIARYVTTITDDITRSTANHPDLIDIVKTGKWSRFDKAGKEKVSAVFQDIPKINPEFTHHLRGYDEIGPEKIKGRANIRFDESLEFPARWGAAVDRVMSLLMGTPTSTLSRSPAFRQFVWKRAAELLPYADDAARVKVLANAKKAGLNARQMRTLEKAAVRGKKFAPPGPVGRVVSVGDSPLDYGVPVKRFAIYDDAAKASGSTYFDGEPGLIGFIDYSPSLRRPGETYIHYMSVEPSREGQGIAKRLVDHLYKSTDEQIDWGDIVSERAGAMHKQFKEAYPDRGNYGKNYYGEIPPKPVKPPTPVYAGKLNADDIDLLAKGHAVDDTKALLYDLSERSQITDIMRTIVPFGEAWKEVITRWAKLATISGPGGIPLPGKPVRRFQQVIQGARGEDFGEVMGAGVDVDPITGEHKQRGFFYKNEFGDEVYAYPGSEWATAALTGIPVPLTGRVQGLNMFGTIIPGLGPVAQIPIAWFLQDKPQLDEWREQLLPFGAPGSNKAADVVDLRAYLPAWAKTLVDVITEGGQDDRIWNSSIMYAATYLYSTGEYGDTVEEQQRLLEDAKDAIKGEHGPFSGLYGIRMLGQFMLPSSPTFEWVTMAEDGRLINTRILAEEFYELQKLDYDTAVENFLDMYGPNAIGAIIPHSRSVISAVPTSLEGAKWVAAHRDIEKKFDLVYGFFAPEGEFHMPTYARNFMTGARDPITPEQWLFLRDTLIGNYHFNKAKDMLGEDRNSPNDKQAAWLREQRAAILESYPNWNNRIGLAGKATDDNDRMIAQLYDAVRNKTVKNTEAGKALGFYLIQRDKAVAQAEAAGFASFKTANDMAPTRQWLTDEAYAIIAEYPAFERLWDVVFSREMEDATIEPKPSGSQ